MVDRALSILRRTGVRIAALREGLPNTKTRAVMMMIPVVLLFAAYLFGLYIAALKDMLAFRFEPWGHATVKHRDESVETIYTRTGLWGIVAIIPFRLLWR